jgi:hypothetical protein
VVLVVVAVAAGAAVAVIMLRHSSGGRGGSPAVTSTSTPAALTSGVAPWTLRAPIEAEVVVVPPASGTAGAVAPGTLLEVAGGSTTGNQPASGIFTLDVSSGTLVHIANLTSVLADAAGAVVGGQSVVFGGATPTPVATVQALPAAPTGTAPARVPTATVVGSLPEPRAGAGALTVGATTYIVGGSNGATPDPTVLATADGRAFAVVATLPVPVAFPAVAAAGSKLYVFGGQALTGTNSGQPVATVQMVDLRSHRAKVVGRLPETLQGAAAVVLGGKVYVVGGDTSAPPPASPTSAPSATGSTTGAQGTQTSGAVWAFDPSNVSFSGAGRLQTPVARAGVAVLGSSAWLVGGTSSGAPTSIVQSLAVAPTATHTG